MSIKEKQIESKPILGVGLNGSLQTPTLLPEPTIAAPVLFPYERSEQSIVTDSASNPKFRIRPATEHDISKIVDVDMQSFSRVYDGYDEDPAALRQSLQEKFVGRFKLVGGGWMPVLERDGEIVGFMTCCPTSKDPEEFESWEKTTDNGTLETTYDPDGKNVYVVTLSVLPEGSAGKDMLFAHQIGKMLREGYDRGFFESRLPGLRAWAESVVGTGEDLNSLDEQQKDELANQYFNQFTEVKGRSVRLDRLLTLYERVGCRFLRVVPDAYQDEESMNFGVVCVYDGANLFDGSDLPFKVPQNRLTRWAFGVLLQSVAKSAKTSRKLFGGS